MQTLGTIAEAEWGSMTSFQFVNPFNFVSYLKFWFPSHSYFVLIAMQLLVKDVWKLHYKFQQCINKELLLAGRCCLLNWKQALQCFAVVKLPSELSLSVPYSLLLFPHLFSSLRPQLHFSGARHKRLLMQCLHAKHLSLCFALEHQQAGRWQDIIRIQHSRARNGEADD